MVLRLQYSLLLLLCLFCMRFQESLCLSFGKLPPRPSQGVRLYLAGESKEISNFSVIRANQFFDRDYISPDSGSPDDINDGLWCQSANNKVNIGTWYLPNGKPVPTEDIDGHANIPLQAYNNASGQVGLLRDDKLGSHEGIFKCVIADEKEVNVTLAVAIYSKDNYDNSVGPEVPSDPLQFSLISTRDVTPPVFTLTFNVTHRPPTDVTCIKDNSLILKIDKQKDLSREILQSTTPIIVRVTVTLREGGSGVYICNVSNARVDNKDVYPGTTPSKRVRAGGTPVNLTAIRFSSTTATLSWIPSVANDSFVKGYEVFYNDLNGFNESLLVSKAKTEVTLTGLSENVEYSAFVVSYGDLPSEHSNIVMIPAEYESYSFEVCGSFFLPCETWDINITSSIKSFIKSVLVNAVSKKCHCNDVSIINEVLTCDNVISTQIKYKANITGSKSFNSYELASFIEQWVSTDFIKLHSRCLVSSDIEKNITCRQMKTAAKTETSTIIITSTPTTTVTTTHSPIVHIPLSSTSSQSMIVKPTSNSVVTSHSISTLVITGVISVLVTAVIMMSIFILLLILIKKKYDRSICRSTRSVFRNGASKKYPSMTDFQMIECTAYQSANERHNTVVYDQLTTMYTKIEDSSHHQLPTPPPSSSPSPQPPLSQEERTTTIIYETII